jgi:hypothetical protein
MSNTPDAITLLIDLPDVVETPYRIQVRCGETTCEVYEHGHRGSGDWAAWKAQGFIIGNGGKVGYTIERALDDARQYVCDEERSRLLYAQLRAALKGDQP